MDPPSILIVEDEPDIAELLVHVMRDEGYQVQHAENGLIALAMLLAAPVDLLLTDLTMPVMSGHQLIKAVAENPDLKKIPILVLSALPKDGMAVGKGSAVSGYMHKPFRVRQLTETVGSLLAQAMLHLLQYPSHAGRNRLRP